MFVCMRASVCVVLHGKATKNYAKVLGCLCSSVRQMDASLELGSCGLSGFVSFLRWFAILGVAIQQVSGQ